MRYSMFKMWRRVLCNDSKTSRVGQLPRWRVEMIFIKAMPALIVTPPLSATSGFVTSTSWALASKFGATLPRQRSPLGGITLMTKSPCTLRRLKKVLDWVLSWYRLILKSPLSNISLFRIDSWERQASKATQKYFHFLHRESNRHLRLWYENPLISTTIPTTYISILRQMSWMLGWFPDNCVHKLLHHPLMPTIDCIQH